jgi:surface antigen
MEHRSGGDYQMLRIKAAVMAAMVMVSLTLGAAPAAASDGQSWQCATYARFFSGVQLFGRAAGWWQQAVGKYAQGTAPKLGSVMVMKATGVMRSGHVATVSRIVSDRVIKVTHANWSRINGHRGQIERDVDVVDVSEKGDWSKVKVWYASLKGIGTTAYPVYGFIYKDGADAAPTKVAANDTPVVKAGL